MQAIASAYSADKRINSYAEIPADSTKKQNSPLPSLMWTRLRSRVGIVLVLGAMLLIGSLWKIPVENNFPRDLSITQMKKGTTNSELDVLMNASGKGL